MDAGTDPIDGDTRAFARQAVGPGLDNPSLAAGDFESLPLLSETGVFSDLPSLTPHAAFVPYGVNTPLWSDAAIKTRWVAVPNDGAPYGEGETVVFSETGVWDFPAGTVTVKHFELVIDETTGARKRLETRIGVRLTGGAFAGASYRWREDHSDADLVTVTEDEVNEITTADGSHPWTHTYPDPTLCTECHLDASGFALALRTAQLNGDLAYPGGVTQNQLRAWGRAGMFSGVFDEAAIPGYLRTVAIDDESASLEARARSYFEANCSSCHHPAGSNKAWDARFATPLAEQKLVGSKVQPGDPLGSTLYERMSYAAVDTPESAGLMMPTIAKNHVDAYALDIVRQWILSLP